MVSPLLFVFLDTLVRGIVLVGLAVLVGFVVKGMVNGFPPLIDPDHRYLETQVHKYNTLNTTGLCHDLDPWVHVFHAECAKEHLAHEQQTDQYYEVWLKESNVKGICEHCKSE